MVYITQESTFSRTSSVYFGFRCENIGARLGVSQILNLTVKGHFNKISGHFTTTPTLVIS